MSNYTIPGSTASAVILQPSPSTGYVSLFLGATETTGAPMISLNAGTSNPGSVFVVGLGGINGAFASSLGNAGQNTSAYQTIHQNLYNQAPAGGHAANSTFSAGDPLVFSLVQRPNAALNLPGYDGTVFIDIFNPSQVPNNNSLNYGMVYLLPPNNVSGSYATDQDFLEAVKASCITTVKALNLYNTAFAAPGNPDGLKQLNTLRMCLFSGGIYRGMATVDQVAQYNVMGLQDGLAQNPGTLSMVEFEFNQAAQWLQPAV